MGKNTNGRKQSKEMQRVRRRQQPVESELESQLLSWVVMKNILTCKHLDLKQQDQAGPEEEEEAAQKKKQTENKAEITTEESSSKKNKKMRCSGSLCNINTKVMHRPAEQPPQSSASPQLLLLLQRKSRAAAPSSSRRRDGEVSNRSFKPPILKEQRLTSNTNNNNNNNKNDDSSSSNSGYSIKGMPLQLPFRRLSGCYECRMVVDPVLGFTRDPSLKATICSCPHCGQVFMKPDNLELHQAVRHAVSEVGAEDTSRNIVEIIFQSSWLKKAASSVCKIDRILKVENTQRTVNKFEEYRDSIKFKAAATKLPLKDYGRCIADGNELLRFHSTSFLCSLGLNGSSNLCNSIPHCNVCSIIKNGFKLITHHHHHHHQGIINNNINGILTTATSGRAHDHAHLVVDDNNNQPCRAMLVCRVIAGRVKKINEAAGGADSQEDDHDSVAGATGVYSNLDELYVFNPKAILPCFVVIYRGF